MESPSTVHMEIKEIAGKIVLGEDVSELTKDFTTEQKVELEKETLNLATEAKNKELAEVSALRKEKTRLQAKADEATKDVQERIRSEQSVKAKVRLVKEFNLSPEDSAKVDMGFKTEAFDADLIYEDYKRQYAYTFADRLIKDSQEKVTLEKNAAQFMSGSAGGTSGGAGGGGEGKTYDPAIYEMVKEAQKRGINLTLEQAEKGMNYKPRITG